MRTTVHAVLAVAVVTLTVSLSQAHSTKEPMVVQAVGEGDLHFLAAQPYLVTEDFKTQQALEKALLPTLQLAEQSGFLSSKTVVVFPELLGLYLYFMNEPGAVYESEDLFSAGAHMVKSRLFNVRTAFSFLAQPPFWLKGKPLDVSALFYRKLLNEKAPEVARAYQSVFAGLARKFQVVIVAGSVPLPSPHVSPNGELLVNVRGEMKNVSALFHPDGHIDPELTVKAFPTQSEELDLFISKQSPEELPVYDLPFGRLAIAICADSWYPKVYSHYESQTVDFLMVPAYIAGEHAGELPWRGYNFASGIQAPEGVDPADVGTLTEWQAWGKYALPGRITDTSMRVGLSSFMKGHLWGERFFGAPHLVRKREAKVLENHPRAGSLVLLRSH